MLSRSHAVRGSYSDYFKLLVLCLGFLPSVLYSEHSLEASQDQQLYLEENWQKFSETARLSLEANVVKVPRGQFLLAGKNQFKTAWTRDFCHSVRGLLAVQKYEVIKEHLSFLLSHIRASDGQAPVFIDSISPKKRGALVSLSHLLPFIGSPDFGNDLKVYYDSVHGYPTIDANVLILLAALDYVNTTQDWDWWQTHEEKLVKVYRYYDSHIKEGLIEQGPFADWQDSVRREGKTFLSNLLYYAVSERLEKFPRFESTEAKQREHRGKIEEAFFDSETGLYRSIKDQPYISVEGNLLAIDLGYLPAASDEARSLYEALKQHPLWTAYALPGIATYPNYPSSWQYPELRLIGLGNYHGNIIWSWTLALAAKVSYRMEDQHDGERISATLMRMVLRDQAVAEIYTPAAENDYPAYKSWLYWSESPFSWGSAYVLDLISYVNKSN